MYRNFFKRIFDFVLALAALIFLSPVLIFVAVAIYIESGRPALYLQARVGRGLRTFSIFKFRSMVVDADKVGGYSTTSNDVRITKVGRFIRRTSLDELPQLLNVLFGDMSLVGPRPDVPKQVEQYETQEIWQERHTVRPGITGLAQAVYRSSATPKQRTDADLEYARNVSFFGDIKIILKTVEVLFARRGVN